MKARTWSMMALMFLKVIASGKWVGVGLCILDKEWEYSKTQFPTKCCAVNSISAVSFPVPCAPQNVKYTGNRQSAMLSWDASVFATSYTVYNVSGGGRVRICSTTGLSCQQTNFDPSSTEVTASNAEGESTPTRDITGQTQGDNVCSTTKDPAKKSLTIPLISAVATRLYSTLLFV